MKKILIVLLMTFMAVPAMAQNKKAKAAIEVDGVCLMCKYRIEKAAIKTKGVKAASWNVQTHVLSLVYDEGKTDLTTIKQNIANVGHDTDEIIATDEAYESVDNCCRYRDEQVIKDHQKTDDGGGH